MGRAISAVAACVILMAGCGPAEDREHIVGSKATQSKSDEVQVTGGPLRVGAASAIVNPPVGTYIAGDAKNRRFTGVHDDLYSKAVVFDDGATPLAVVVVDCIGLLWPTVNEIREAAAARLTDIDLLAERIIITSTHSHAGPDVIGIWGPNETTTGRDEEYMTQLVETTAKVIVEAASKREPATLYYGEGESGEGWVVNDCEPGEVDRAVAVLQCVDAEGASIATLTNFACHPTCVDGTISEVSADYIGTFYKEMADLYPGEHLFLQGAIGGWIQPDTPERTHALAETYGKTFAADVLAALETRKPLDGTAIRFANRIFEVPVENEGFKQLGAMGIVPRQFTDGVRTEVAWFSIGSAHFATHPGETSPIHGWATKELMQTGPKFVLGLGLDELGYILKEEYFDDAGMPHAEYLTSMSPGRQASSVIMAQIEAIIP
jgi:neutral/alkaline ceramidase-like enzyme